MLIVVFLFIKKEKACDTAKYNNLLIEDKIIYTSKSFLNSLTEILNIHEVKKIVNISDANIIASRRIQYKIALLTVIL